MSTLAYDAIELGQLQAKLLKLDASESARNVRSSLILLCIALAALLAALPVALIAAAEALVEYADWSRPAALGISAGAASALCVLLLIIMWNKLQVAANAWQRSAAEFSRNIAWLKSALKGDTRSRFTEQNHPRNQPSESRS